MSTPAFKDKFVAFVDVLGFKNMVAAAERGEGRSLQEILEIQTKLGRAGEKDSFRAYGPTICPEARRTSKDIDFQITQVSDCVIASAEVSPAGVINLVNYCWASALSLLPGGVMVRGYITRGSIYHEGQNFVGSGYQEALSKESSVSAFRRHAGDTGTPFIEVDPKVCEYVAREGDNCVKEMFKRSVKSDGVATALFPFQRLSHSFIIGGISGRSFDAARERRANDNMRAWITNMKTEVLRHLPLDEGSAKLKAEHYVAALDDQLRVCDRTDEMIDQLVQPFPIQRWPRPNSG